jgi:RND family efflux transporter MFP subunit
LAYLLLAAAIVGWVETPAWSQTGPSPVTVDKVAEHDVLAGQTFVGTVMPRRRSAVGSAVDGRVLEYPINEGDRVSRGQPIAQLLTETLQIERDGAQAELELREKELMELEAGSRPEEIEQAKARMLGAKSLVELWLPRLNRARTLSGRGAGTEDTLQETSSTLEQGRQSLAEAKAAYELAVAGPRVEKIEQARARVAMQQQVVRRIEDQIAKHTIRSPFDGYVIAEKTEIGEWVSKGQVIAEIIELDTIDVEVHVLENYVRNLAPGAPARVEFGAVPDTVFTGEVALVVPQADVRARSFPVKVRVENRRDGDNLLLKSGMFARVSLAVGKLEKAILVSKDALVLGGEVPIVFVVDLGSNNPELGTVRPVPVEMGVAHEGMIQVKGPLKAGDWVVVQGNERLRPGQEVLPMPLKPPVSAAAQPRPAAGSSDASAARGSQR